MLSNLSKSAIPNATFDFQPCVVAIPPALSLAISTIAQLRREAAFRRALETIGLAPLAKAYEQISLFYLIFRSWLSYVAEEIPKDVAFGPVLCNF